MLLGPGSGPGQRGERRTLKSLIVHHAAPPASAGDHVPEQWGEAGAGKLQGSEGMGSIFGDRGPFLAEQESTDIEIKHLAAGLFVF